MTTFTSMKKTVLSFLAVAGFAALLMPAAPALAADPVAAPGLAGIAVVDMNKVLQVSEAAKDARNQLEAKRKEYQDQITSQETSLRSSEQELIKNKSSLSEEEFNKKRAALEEKIVSAQKLVQEHKKSLDTGFNNSLNALQNEIAGIVGDIAKERKLSLVLSNEGIILGERSLDITDEVLSRLNKKITKLPVNWTAKSEGKKK